MGEPSPAVAPPVAVAFAVIGFFALLVGGFGMLSLLSGAEVLAVAGLGPVPGVLAVVAAVLVFALGAWLSVRRRAGYASVPVVAIATFLAYLAGIVVGGLVAGVDAARTVAAAGSFATSWFAAVLGAAALVGGWAAVALVRTRASRPRWPWERDDDLEP